MWTEGSDDKKATYEVSLSLGLLTKGWIGEWVVAQIRDYCGLIRLGWIHVVAFPAAQGDGANLQSASGFRLEDSQLEATATKVAANGVWSFRNWNAAVVGWQILVSGHVQDPFTKRQRRAP